MYIYIHLANLNYLIVLYNAWFKQSRLKDGTLYLKTVLACFWYDFVAFYQLLFF